MGLKKEVPTLTGVVATYHNIGDIRLDYRGREVNVRIDSYASQEARQEGKTFLQASSLSFDGDSSAPFFKGDPRKTMYSWLKKQPEWEGAEDV